MSQRAAVLGSPVSHSLSPVIHRAAYAWLGLDWDYGWVDLQPDHFGSFLAGLDPSWRGLSVTMPLKGVAAGSGTPDEDVLLTAAANTVVLGSERRVYNTDIPGFIDALRAAGASEVGTATLIGNGATARSAAVALSRLGARLIQVMGRNPEHVERFTHWASALDVEVQVRSWRAPLDPETRILVSTIPADGMATLIDHLDIDVCPELRTVFDVIYHPWPTALAVRADRPGVRVVNGLDLLVHQAVHQVQLMTGQQVPAEVLMSAVREELSRRGQS